MSDSSDDEPIALKRRKVEHTNGIDKPAARQVKTPASYKEDSDSDEEVELPTKQAAQKRKSPSKASAAGHETSKAARKVQVKKEATVKKEVGLKKEDVSKDKKAPVVKREKKVFENPGQTRDTPDETDPLRKFYSSLSDQRPESLMAKKWLCMHGLLSVDEAEAYLADIGKLKSPEKKKSVSNAGKKTVTKPRKSNATKPSPAKRKQKIKEEEDQESDDNSEDEFIIAKKPVVKKKAVQNKASADKPVQKKPASKPRDVAFEDGGLDGDSSDDDVPLAVRRVGT